MSNHISKHIDRKIVEFLDSQGWEVTKKYLEDRCLNFSKQLDRNPNSEFRKRKLEEYVSHAKKRIGDLGVIQTKWSGFKYSPKKTFELLLLKEKLQKL